VETDEEREDDEESIAGTEVDDIESLGAAVDALELIDEESEDQTVVVDEVVLEEACIDDDVEIVEEVAEVPVAQTGTHIRFEDSPLVNRDASRSPRVSRNVRRSRNRTARRGAILDSDEEDSLEDESSEANEDEDASSPAVSARPRRATTRKPSFTFKNAFIDDDLSGSEEFEYDEEAHTSDDDFIADEDDEDGEYRVEYDSDAENVTPAPRKPTTETDISKEVAEKLVIDEYSPSNLHTPTPPKELSPTSAVKAFRPPPSHSKALQSALKSVAKKGHAKFNFNRHKDALTSALFEEFNESVFDGALPRDFTVTWNNKLLTTAGLTHYKRSSKSGETTYSARIELSTKVLDTVEKLEATLLHEMCHASAWLVDKTAKPPHGPVFKKWAQLAMSVYPETCVSTCHAYTIHQPYKWRCTRDWCQQEYGRHSKSIDIAKKGCGACGGKLEYLGKFKKNGDVIQSRAPTAFSLFVKEHFKDAKKKLGASTPHKDVMKHLSQRWKLETTKETAKVIDVSD
jgi:predicted SprT family Zn-dependent metalloprotease